MDEEDEWFFNSIKRYNKLQMFDFEKTVKDMDLSLENNLCIALETDKNNKNEILVCSLPTTLQLKSGNSDVKFDRHISFSHGYFTDTPLVQMKCIPNKENLIISEKRYVRLYDISCKETDMIQKMSEIPCTVTNAKIGVHPSRSVVALSGSQNEARSVVDYGSMEVVFSNNSEDSSNVEGDIVPLFCAPDVISFGNTISGSLVLHDIREKKRIDSITVPDIIETTKSSLSCWLFNSTYSVIREPAEAEAKFYLFSTNGNFLIYDWRNLKEALHYSKHPFDCESKVGPTWAVQMAVNPTDLDTLTVCGFDENVYVCQIKDDKLEVQFTHDGHPYSKDDFEANVTTVCSMWIPFISSSTIVSCASNTSLQCWQFLI